MSNNITKFLNSRSEVKLSSEKIELALNDDLNKYKSQAEALKKEMDSLSASVIQKNKELRDLINKAKQKDGEVSKIEKGAGSVWDEIKKLSAQLGIDSKSTDSFKLHENILSLLLTTPSLKELESIARI